MQVDVEALMDAARSVQPRAHAPFSGYSVGAAVIDEAGNLHRGCNVENTAYPEGICAEANAIGSMVAAGGRRIVAIAVVGAAGSETSGEFAAKAGTCMPCGGCRQRILEFADSHTVIIVSDHAGQHLSYTLSELLPHAFQLD